MTRLRHAAPRRRILLGLGGALAGLSGCAPVDVLNATIPVGDVRVWRGIPYASGEVADNPRLRLDVYRPAGDAPAPMVVFFYGGSWQEGRRQDYRFVAVALAARGIIAVLPDYRVYPEVTYPAFITDGAAAMAYSLRNAAAWGGDLARVFVAGHSAGAYIAAMLALDPDYLAAAGADRGALAGTIGLSGPYDFRPIVRRDIRAVFGRAADSDAAQPISHVDGRNHRMLLIAGLADTTVEPRNTRALAERIAARGGPVETRLYPGIDHIGTVAAFAPLLRGEDPVLRDVTTFIGATKRSIPPV